MAHTSKRAIRSDAWRWQLIATTSGERVRLPRDVVAVVAGTLVATSFWLTIARGVGSPLELTVPNSVAWLVTLAAICGTYGVFAIALSVITLSRQVDLFAKVTAAGLVAAVTCVGAAHALGESLAYAPPLLGACFAVATVAIRAVAAPLRGRLWLLVVIGAVAQSLDAHLVTLGSFAASSWGVAVGAGVALAVGSDNTFETLDDVTFYLSRLHIDARDLHLDPDRPTWGAHRYRALGTNGESLDIDIYGRDAPEGQLLAKVWRFLWIKRSRLDLRLRRRDHLDRSAEILLWAHELDVHAPRLIAAAQLKPTDVGVLVTQRPAGTRLSDIDPSKLSDDVLSEMWTSLTRLHNVGIALHSLSGETISVDERGGVAFCDIADATTLSGHDATRRDDAALLTSTARIVGTARAVSAVLRTRRTDDVVDLLPLIQPLVVTGRRPDTTRRSRRDLRDIRDACARELGVDSVEPVALARFQVSKVLMLLGTFFGLWLLIEQLIGLQGIGDTLRGTTWAWVVATLFITQATNVTEALSISGTLPIDIPLGPLTLLRFALAFTGLIGGTVANTAAIIRFNQRHGLDAAVAVSSALIYSVAGFVVQIILMLVCFLAAPGDFSYHADGSPGSGSHYLEIAVMVIAAAGLVLGVAFTIPKVRRLFSSRLRPRMAPAWANLRAIVQRPGRVARIFSGAALTQVMMAIGLGLALRSVGVSAPLGGLIVVCTLTALIGGMAPVPGGMGVMESCYIVGLTLLGVPQDQAIAATLLYRLATTYLPPIWGWGSLVWLRRSDAM